MIDDQIRAAASSGDEDLATTLALEAFGAEVLGWLVDRLRNETAGSDAFALFTEDLWKSWPTFEWRCSARGWCYVLARNAGNRVANRGAVERRRKVTYSSELDELAANIRETTLPHLRTTVKDQFRQLRQKLSDEDQMILVLRVDKKLPWSDIAAVFLGSGSADDDELTRESARLRKRLQIIKEKLSELGREAGLL